MRTLSSDDLIAEVRARAKKEERTIVTTLTKKMAEDLAQFLKEKGMEVTLKVDTQSFQDATASVLTNKTRLPASASAMAVAVDSDVLPTPPFPDVIVMTVAAMNLPSTFL